MWSSCCVNPRNNYWKAEPVFKKSDMYIMAPEPISTEYFTNPSNQFVRLHV
jgi:hypothetical protein